MQHNLESPLSALTPEEWESLCDGCGRCCLVKLEDADSGDIHYTNVSCRYLDTDNCRCNDYQNRAKINSRCMVLDPNSLETLKLMPFTCAYRLLHEGRTIDLDKQGLRVRGRVVSEEYVHEDQLPEHIVDWIQINDAG